jgi:MerR family transcriptional regulator, light-induced transcriptional regulator
MGIGELARRAGVTQEVIRAWESRFGFPAPARTGGGRRQYDVTDLDRIRRVVALRDSGVRLAQAIARVQAEETTGPHSVYAALRERHPQVGSRVLRRDVLVTISRAIEDEAMSRASRPVVFGGFQRERFFRQAEPRWDEIARTASACVVFADFRAPGGGGATPVRVPLDVDSPLLREWAVVVVAASFSVALTAWEVPRQGAVPLRRRSYESMLTVDPAAVRTAAEVCAEVSRVSGAVPPAVLASLEGSLATEPTPTHAVDAFMIRAFDYLQSG